MQFRIKKKLFILKDLRKEILIILLCEQDFIYCILLYFIIYFRLLISRDLYDRMTEIGCIKRVIKALYTLVFTIQCFAFFSVFLLNMRLYLKKFKP